MSGSYTVTDQNSFAGTGRTPGWGWAWAYLNHQEAFRCSKSHVTEFRVVSEW